VHIPALRERLEDLPYLFNHVLSRVVAATGKKRPYVHKDLIDMLSRYSFPGNVRELESMVHESVVAHRSGALSLKVFERWIAEKDGLGKEEYQGNGENAAQAASAASTSPTIIFSCQLPTLREAQDLLINEALKRGNKNQSVAAKLLGVTRQALNRRILHRGKSDELPDNEI
jgi:DNA-binding NtrC family response regulator